jgi:hypothetical protein
MDARPANDGQLWTREHLILAFELYCRIPFQRTKATDSRVKELAALLHRTPASVARKLGNFGAFDPQLAARNISGLTHGSKLHKRTALPGHRPNGASGCSHGRSGAAAKPPDAEPVEDVMRTVKARSSKWVHDTFPPPGGFAWQERSSVFAVSKSQERAVKKYIAGQHGRHKREDFKSELIRLLRAHGVEFDERHVFDQIVVRSDASSAPPGQDRETHPHSTGCAASGCRRAALHPWLHSGAPLGRR